MPTSRINLAGDALLKALVSILKGLEIDLATKFLRLCQCAVRNPKSAIIFE